MPNGLFHAHDPAIWNRVRKLTSPAFSKLNVARMTNQIVQETKKMVVRLAEQASSSIDKSTIDFKESMQNYTVRVISAVAFGNSSHVSYFYSKQFSDDIQAVFKFSIELNLFMFPHWMWKLTSKYQYELKAIEANQRIEKECTEVIKLRRQSLSIDNSSTSDRNHSHNLSNTCLLDILLRQEENKDIAAISDDEITANVKTFYLAGSETTSVAIGWAIYYLTMHPVIVEEMRNEVKDFFESLDAEVNFSEGIGIQHYETILGFSLSMGVFKEGLRLNGPAFALILQPHEKQTELLNGLVVDRKDSLIVNMKYCSNDPKHVDDPSEFNPYRWVCLENSTSTSSHNNYYTKYTNEQVRSLENRNMSFGYGPRICPGMSLAYIEGVLAVAAVFHYFDVALACKPEEIKATLNFTAQPNQLPVRLSKRG